MYRLALVCLLAAVCALAQKVDTLSAHGTSTVVNFSGAGATRVLKTGTTAPATCTVGDLFYDTDATAGQNLYGCTSTNTWTQQAGGGGSSLPSQTGNNNKWLTTDGTNATWEGLTSGPSGGLSFDYNQSPVEIDIVTTVVPRYAATNTWTGSNNFSGASATAPFKIGTSDPATCTATTRQFFYNTTSNTLKVCNTTNVWSTYTTTPESPLSVFTWASLPTYGGASASVTATTNQVKTYVLVVHSPVLVSKCGFYAPNTTIAGNVRCGIYNSSGTRLAQTSSIPIAASTASAYSGTFTEQTLDRGHYIVAIAADAAVTITGGSSTNIFAPANAVSSVVSVGIATNAMSGGSLPASLGTITAETGQLLNVHIGN